MPVIKLAASKVTLPDRKQVWRRRDADSKLAGDTIGLADEHLDGEPLLQSVMTDGKPTMPYPDVHVIRQHAAEQVASLPPACLAIRDAAPYPVDVSARLQALVEELSRR